MCHDARRGAETPFEPGVLVDTESWAEIGPERCTSVAAALWWSGDGYEGAPAAGFYTEATCAKMPRPAHVAVARCQVEVLNPCTSPDAPACPAQSVCVREEFGAGCDCPATRFPLLPGGAECSTRALTMTVLVDDARAFRDAGAVDELMSALVLSQLGLAITAAANATLIARRASVVSVAVFEGTRTWKLSLDIPFQWLDVTAISREPAAVRSVVNSTAAAAGFSLSQRGDSVAFVEVNSEQSVVDVDSTGYKVLGYEWVDNDARGLGWQVELEVSRDSPAERVLYVSKAGPGGTLLAANDAQAPCRVGFEPNATCCLHEFAELYSVVEPLQALPCPNATHSMPGLAVEGSLAPNGTSFSVATPSGASVRIRIFLRLEDIQQRFGAELPSATGIRLHWFLGIAQFYTQGSVVSISTSHTAFESNIATSHTKVTTMSASKTFAPAIDIQLSRVEDVDKARFIDFVTFTLIIPDTESHLRFSEDDTVPLNSALVFIGLTESDGSGQDLRYPCARHDPAEFEKIMQSNPCARHEHICAPALVAPRTLRHTFPLGENAFSQALAEYDRASLLKRNVYFDFYVRMWNSREGREVVERIRTQTEISRTNMAVKCAQVSLKVSLSDAVRFDIISGLLRDDLNASESGGYFSDIARAKNSSDCDPREASSLCLPSPEFGMGSVTFLVLGDSAVFGGARMMQNVRISSMFSVYFLSEVKRVGVLNLIRQGRAFIFRDGETIENSTQLVPSAELLQLCPMHIVRTSFGCISRQVARPLPPCPVTNSVFRTLSDFKTN